MRQSGNSTVCDIGVPPPDNFTYVLPVDAIEHSPDKPFCWDSTCLCHEDEIEIGIVAQQVARRVIYSAGSYRFCRRKRNMKQQQAYPVKRRANLPANPHNFGHSAGFHGEDQPYMSDDLKKMNPYYVTRPPTSARRYQTTMVNQVIQRGNKRIVIHNEPPPKRTFHWSVFFGLGMILALLLWIGASEALAWWNNHQLDSTYGMPRTYQTDAIVYPSDTLEHPSHYIFLNLNGTIVDCRISA